ncbi:alanine--glyoxylate aminotransferase 2, mitochondrial [Archocentrus centrarchus]|uniref:alanine--glyoxylate aminotransferase 2, mitochondrial n=1 Tax=Archocentrus centrarchus TaxID=63155 RepID=UPI0011EA1002|nr:alanine--glyoxylate aminotransferase 2, mitochondrial [Archocentrus centrarchus]XP_030598697.1 alanine--glyoxylate aminotransferase 2, mitochondrial [Archocentrus centrarchus]
MYKPVSALIGRCAVLTRRSCSWPNLAHFHWASGTLCQKSEFKVPPADLPEMPPCNFSPEKYTGMSKDRMIAIRRQNCNPMTMKVTYYKKPVFIHQGYMQWLWDVDGRRYLDLFAGVATVSVGHCHPKVTAAAEQQLKKLWHTTSIYVYPTLHEYCEKLASYFPEPLKVIYLTNSGSEANDLAMLMARLHTGSFDIITFRGSYHGGSPQSIGLTSNAAYKYPIANGLGCTNTMCPDVFRGPWGGSHCRDSPVQTIRECTCSQGHCMANEQYIAQLKETFATSVPHRIAAFFGEPIQGVGGAVQYPKNYLKEAYKLVRERGGICIADEVQTGFGRTGSHFWGFQGHDVIPDMVTVAKGIGNGFPMGAVVTTPEIAASFVKGVHFNTFGGNPVACAVASSVLDTIREDGTQQNSLHVGTYLITELAKLRDKYEIIGDVRGKGLQIGVEMVRDKASREPLPPEAMHEIFEDVKDMGVLIGKGGIYEQTFRIKPPMCITMEDANFFLAVFNKSLHNYMEKR